jgi:hypothetical protein
MKKPIPTDSKARNLFGVRMDQKMIDEVKAASKQTGMTPGEVVRRAVAAFLSSKRTGPSSFKGGSR